MTEKSSMSSDPRGLIRALLADVRSIEEDDGPVWKGGHREQGLIDRYAPLFAAESLHYWLNALSDEQLGGLVRRAANEGYFHPRVVEQIGREFRASFLDLLAELSG